MAATPKMIAATQQPITNEARVRLARVTAAMRADGQPVTWPEFTNRFPDSPGQVAAVSNLLRALERLPSNFSRQTNLPVVGTAIRSRKA